LRRIIAAGVAFWYRYIDRDDADVFTFAPGAVVVVDAAKGFSDAGLTTGGYLAGVYGPNRV
jgi:hypothetical protein